MSRPFQSYRLKARHVPDFTRLLLYAQALYHRRAKKPVENIPLTSLYKTTKYQPLVKMALNVFFTQVFRGNNKTRKTSGWERKEKIHINGQVNRFLYNLKLDNQAVITEMIAVATHKPGEVQITTKVQFKDQAQAEAFILSLTPDSLQT